MREDLQGRASPGEPRPAAFAARPSTVDGFVGVVAGAKLRGPAEGGEVPSMLAAAFIALLILRRRWLRRMG